MPNSPLTVSRSTRRWALIPLGALAIAMVAVSSGAAPADKPTPPLSDQTFTVVQATGINAVANAAFDVQKPVTLKKGQMVVLKSSSGQVIEIAGPFHGKPIDHYTLVPPNTTMGYDAHSFGSHGKCTDTSGGPHPSSGPNPDETAGSENSATHCH